MSEENPKTTYIVSGATATLGKELLAHFSKQAGAVCFGLSRRSLTFLSSNVHSRHCDLTDAEGTKAVVSEIVDEAVQQGQDRIVLANAVGPFKFEYTKPEDLARIRAWAAKEDWSVGKNPSEVDEDVYRLNVHTMEALGDGVMEGVERVSGSLRSPNGLDVKIGTFGSTTEDKPIAALWYSFAFAKMRVREYLDVLAERGQRLTDQGVSLSTFYLRLSTLAADSEYDLRPQAEEETRRFWLTARDVVQKTDELVRVARAGELNLDDIYVHNPNFTMDYYDGIDTALARWRAQTGVEGTKNEPGW